MKRSSRVNSHSVIISRPLPFQFDAIVWLMKIEWVVLSHYNGSRCCNRCLYPHYNSLVMLVLLYDIILLLMKIKKLTRVKKNSFTWIQRFFYIIISPECLCAFLYYFYFIFCLKLLTIFLLLQCTSKQR